jgi:spermidine/putrescine transport system permease protein
MSEPSSRAGNVARWSLNGFAVIAMFYLFVPILWIVAYSFNKPVGKFNYIWQEFTLDNWADPLGDEALTDALWESLKIAGVATLIATVLGTMIAIALARYRFAGLGLLAFMLVLPLTTPEIVIGTSLATLFRGKDVNSGYTTVIIAHVMFQVSFVALTVRARARGFDFGLEQASQDLGATPMRTFWKVTFPLLLPGILAAALLAFALSIDDFIITLFNAGPVNTFPLYVNASQKVSFTPQINVLATLVLLFSVTLLAAGALWGIFRDKRARTA